MSDLTAAEYRALAQFRRALRLFVRFSEDAARRAGLTPAQHQLLLAIKGRDASEPLTASSLAEALQLRLHSAVELIARAERSGLVRRRADPADGRRALISLTPRGERHLAALSREHRTELRRFRTEMSEVLRELG